MFTVQVSTFHVFFQARAASLLEKSKTAAVASSPSPPETRSKGTQSSAAVASSPPPPPETRSKGTQSTATFVSPAPSSNASSSPAVPAKTIVKTVSFAPSPPATQSPPPPPLPVNVEANEASLPPPPPPPENAKPETAEEKNEKVRFRCKKCVFR